MEIELMERENEKWDNLGNPQRNLLSKDADKGEDPGKRMKWNDEVTSHCKIAPEGGGENHEFSKQIETVDYNYIWKGQ